MKAREYEAKPASQQKVVARALLDAKTALDSVDGWLSEIDIEDAVDVGNGSVHAYLTNLVSRGLAEMNDEGTVKKYRMADEQKMLAYLDGTAAAQTPEEIAARSNRGNATNESRRRIDASMTKGEGFKPFQVTEEPQESADEIVQVPTLTYAVDHTGKLVLCFGDDAHAFVLRPAQWAPLATFLHRLLPAFNA